MKVEQKLKEMGLELPPVADPAGLYVYTRRVGNLVYVSGQTPDINSVLQVKGVVGETLTLEEGKSAAKLSALNVLSVLKRELGDLDRVKQFVHLTGFVRCTQDFEEHPQVINGASELFRDLYGTAGVGTRIALGAYALPEGAPIELTAIVEVTD